MWMTEFPPHCPIPATKEIYRNKNTRWINELLFLVSAQENTEMGFPHDSSRMNHRGENMYTWFMLHEWELKAMCLWPMPHERKVRNTYTWFLSRASQGENMYPMIHVTQISSGERILVIHAIRYLRWETYTHDSCMPDEWKVGNMNAWFTSSESQLELMYVWFMLHEWNGRNMYVWFVWYEWKAGNMYPWFMHAGWLEIGKHPRFVHLERITDGNSARITQAT